MWKPSDEGRRRGPLGWTATLVVSTCEPPHHRGRRRALGTVLHPLPRTSGTRARSAENATPEGPRRPGRASPGALPRAHPASSEVGASRGLATASPTRVECGVAGWQNSPISVAMAVRPGGLCRTAIGLPDCLTATRLQLERSHVPPHWGDQLTQRGVGAVPSSHWNENRPPRIGRVGGVSGSARVVSPAQRVMAARSRGNRTATGGFGLGGSGQGHLVAGPMAAMQGQTTDEAPTKRLTQTA